MSDFNCDCSPTYPNGATAPIPPFWGFSAFTPTIPKLYWDVKSQEQRILNLFDLLNKLVCYCDNMGLQIDVNAQDIQEIRDYVNEFITSGFDDALAEKVAKWIDDHLQFIFTHTIRQVYFGLTDDGHFCAYVPDSWSDIQFDTGAVYGRSDYGRLILKFEPDPNAHNVIDNTYSNYTLNAEQQTMQRLIADLESTTRRSDATYNAMFSNLDVEVNNGNF